MGSNTIRSFSLTEYIDAAIALAEYEKGQTDAVVAIVPEMQGYYSQGDTFEEAPSNLRDAIEGIVMLRLQLGWKIQEIPRVEIREEVVETAV